MDVCTHQNGSYWCSAHAFRKLCFCFCPRASKDRGNWVVPENVLVLILICFLWKENKVKLSVEQMSNDAVGRPLVVTDANARGTWLPLCINLFFLPVCVFFLSELHHYRIICRMVLQIYVGFKNKTIIDAVQDVTQSVLFCFILYIFSGILYITVGVKIVF